MRLAIALLTVLPLLAACASDASVRAPKTRLTAAFEAQVQSAAVPLDRWWMAYTAPQLVSLNAEALTKSPTAELAIARLEEARATRVINRTNALPKGDISLMAGRRGSNQISGAASAFSSNGVTDTLSAGFDVSWEVDIWRKVRVGRQGIDDDFASKVFNIEASRAALAANVADSLFAARGLAQQLEDARESARIARESQRVAGVLADRGLAARGDAEATAANVAQADAAVTGLAAELTAARRSILVLIGRGTDPVESLTITPAVGEPPLPPAGVPGELLERRPDVREADKRLKVAIAQLEVDRINLFPKFTLMPGVGIARTSTNSFTGFDTTGAPTFGQVTQTIANWSLGVGVGVPILDRPRLLATLKASGARAEQAVIAYEASVQTAYGEAENALTGLKADRERLTLLEGGERSARAAYEAARVRYNAGLTDLPVLLQAEQAWRSARSQATAARSQALRRSVQTFKALGGGWSLGDDLKT